MNSANLPLRKDPYHPVRVRTHGITAQDLIIDSNGYKESRADLNKLHRGMVDYWSPDGTQEEMIVYNIVAHHWRLQRLYRYESRVLANENGPTYGMKADSLLGHFKALINAIDKDSRLLMDLQHRRRTLNRFDN
jgi:hypothetical protein